MKRLVLFSVLSLVLLLVFPVFAGGWSVVTLDSLPDKIVAGQPVNVGFMVRQHGQTPMAGLTPEIKLQKADAPKLFRVVARPSGGVGHYTAAITFPDAGEWNWTINAFPEPQTMPQLTVLSAGSSASAEASPLPMMVGGVGLAVAVGAALIFFRARVAWAAALILAGALVGAMGFASTATHDNGSAAVGPVYTQEQLGQRLFVAKGCVTCHIHESVRQGWQGLSVDIGPNLTNFTANPGYLTKWLYNPPALKPNTQMPRLGLSEEEMKALIAFINAP
ncbi:MAG: c-type cytochrome [Chloroflexi bacterium]|nr:c-type cytochrome [Chloroflexota bacterium]